MRCRAGVRPRGRGGAAAAAARGRRAAARAHQAAGGLSARAHARPAGAERLRAASATSWPPPTPELGARRWTRWRGSPRATRPSSCSATRSWREAAGTAARRREPGRRRRGPARRATPPTRGWARRARAPRARRWWSSTTRPRAERLASAIYGGARAYLPRAALDAARARRGLGGGAPPGRGAGDEDRRDAGQARHPDGRRADAHAQRRSATSTCSLIADTATPRATRPVVPTGHEVLVVDDEAVVLTVLREALRRGGYRVTTAASAEEAIDLMHKRRFDLVLTDKNLPGASGLDVLRAARTLEPGACDRAHHRLQLVRFGGRGPGHRRARLHRKADPRRRRSALPDPARAVAPRRAARAPEADAATGGRAGRVLLVEVEGHAAPAASPSTWARATTSPRPRTATRRWSCSSTRTSIWCWPIATCPAARGCA